MITALFGYDNVMEIYYILAHLVPLKLRNIKYFNFSYVFYLITFQIVHYHVIFELSKFFYNYPHLFSWPSRYDFSSIIKLIETL